MKPKYTACAALLTIFSLNVNSFQNLSGGENARAEGPATERIQVNGTYSPYDPIGSIPTNRGSSSGNSSGGISQAAKEKKEKECKDKTLTANTGLKECVKLLTQEVAIIHQAVCQNENSYTGNFSVSIAGKVVSALLGASVTSDNYTKCNNQLNYNAAAVAADCEFVHAEVIESACKGV